MKRCLLIILFGFLYISCQSESVIEKQDTITVFEEQEPEPEIILSSNPTLKILSLGDSYTIGESVCKTCRFPEQLKSRLLNKISNIDIDLEIIAQTGWTTSVLKQAIANSNIGTDQDLVTLLIGVNNQYQGVPFKTFETEFSELVASAIKFAKGKKEKVIIISIPDYAYTPFGQGNQSISSAIDVYNNFIYNFCQTHDISYVYITDITREGLEQPNLVASDGLHPSGLAYGQFVDLIIPLAEEKIEE
ncbi:SGNH/GDSL hydrolase family protein [Postechiella marina]|uniref:SGNH/GDSL hydrolase family protein n=1 Tax=Postechiella marina TaxID=943941 RepID=A0ABP8C3F7_9FLAO